MTQTFRLLLLIVLASVLATGCGGKKRKQRLAQASQFHQLGTQKLGEGNAEGAVADLTQATKLDPKNADIIHALGLAYWHKGTVVGDESLKSEGEKRILESFKLKGEDKVPGDWRNNLGALYVDMSRWPDAIVQLEKAIKDPEYRTPERPLNNLAKASLEQRKYVEAIAYADRALRIQPRFCLAMVNKAAAEQALKKRDDAIETFSGVVKECPEYPEPYLQLGVLYFEGKNKSEAKKYWLLAKERDPDGKFGKEAEKYLRTSGK